MRDHQQARASEGERVKVAAIVAAFVALTAWNVTAGHMGLVAIDRAALADKRAPLERAEAAAAAQARAAAEALVAFAAATERQSALWADSLRGLSPLAVSAGTRRIEAAAAGQARRETERSALAAAKAKAEAEAANAAAAVENGPRPRPDRDLWAFALVLELLKGALVWFATGRERKSAAERSAQIVALAPVTAVDMSEDELRAMASRGASLQATARHELTRRAKAAA